MSKNNKGWVSIDREIADHWVWNCEFSIGQAWIDLLINATHSQTKFMLKGQLISLKRGQQARSILTLSKTWKWSRGKVIRFLKNLENDHMIEQRAVQHTTIITICKYSDYQEAKKLGGTPDGHQTEQRSDTKRDTFNNDNNVNNVNKKATAGKIPAQHQQSFFDLYNEKFPMLMPVKVPTEKRMMTVDKFIAQRSKELEKDYTVEMLEGYFDFILTHCTWMLREGISSSTGKAYKPKTFDYFMTDDCYSAVKEQRFNDGSV